MELPVRILGEAPAGAFVAVDGHLEGAALELSHWPGNRTPRELRHDLSTGAALRFARLAPARRAELAGGALAIVNNHYDTDGSCALFATRHPRAALEREGALLRAAAAGDFFRWPDDDALTLDAIVTGLADGQRSPLAPRFAGLDALARHQLATDVLLEELPALLEGERAAWTDLWEPELEAARRDREDLQRCTRDDLAHLDWTIWTAPSGARSTRAARLDDFDPGRHALFGASEADRLLVVGPGQGGSTYRLLLSTLSWFDLVSRTARPRPDLAALAQRLNELEDTDPAADTAWRCQPGDGPSPELWFGAAQPALFAEHAGVLRPSRLEPSLVRREVAEALRAALLDELGA